MRRRRVQIKILFLDIFAVVALVARQSEKPLLQNRVFFVPKRNGETNQLMPVAKSGDAVFVPAIRAFMRLFKRKVFPHAAPDSE